MENEKGVKNIVSVEMDRDAEPSGESQSETTLSNSPESVLTVESSRGDAESKKLDDCGGWTNERHNSYLDYLESSFVKQLYSLLGGDETRRLSRGRDVQSNSHKSADDKFTVLQNGCRRQKVNLGKKRPGESMRTLGHEYPAQSTAEASGQNFREEGGEKGCNSRVSRKRRREANYDDSSLNDQVVP